MLFLTLRSFGASARAESLCPIARFLRNEISLRFSVEGTNPSISAVVSSHSITVFATKKPPSTRFCVHLLIISFRMDAKP